MDNGQMITKQPGKEDELRITFTGFDEKSRRAILVGNLGSDPVMFLDKADHVQLIQITQGGNVATTTITATEQEITAVQTRHMAIANGGVFSLYSGACRPR
jgi:hypothetical protein